MRRFPSSPSLKRIVERIEPRVEIVIACEGKETEPDYIENCVNFYGAGMVTLRVIEKTGVPITVVNAAIRERKILQDKERKKKRNGEPTSAFSVWAIFDKDEHQVEEALALAKEHKIGVAFSNPCFEIWPILHISNYGSQDGRHLVQRRLHTMMPSYHHEESPRIDFEMIKGRFEEAFIRARHLNEARVGERCEFGCPSTTVGELVKKIQQNGRLTQRRAGARLK